LTPHARLPYERQMIHRAFVAAFGTLACATVPPSPSMPSTTTPESAAAPASCAVTDDSTIDLAAPPDLDAPPVDARRTASGLASKVLRPGCGTQHPGSFSEVRVHYAGWTTDGTNFDSSMSRRAPATFSLNGVIAGWREGVKLMVVGEKRRFWIPEDLAYKGMSGPQGTLVFDIELLDIVRR
jgi:peptidylprolyl isomerase